MNQDKNKKTNRFYNKKFKTNFDIIGKVLSSPNKKKVLFSLNIPRTITDISNTTSINLANTSRTVKELEKIGIIEIHNKNQLKGKIISLNKKGLDLIDDLLEL